MASANGKDSSEMKFSGKQDKGLTFEEFDKKALSWARRNYGNTYAKQLWENTLTNLNNLDLKDDYDYYVFGEHCEYVYDMLCLENPKNADILYSAPKFWTIKWQLENRQRQYEKLFCFLETICEGEAERQLHAEGVEKTNGMRKHMFERFGSGQPSVLQERVRKYLLGMPDKNGVAFHPRVNMPDKLAQLEQERDYLLRMCPKEKHKDYDEGKETTLVRLILNTLPAEYDDAVQNVRNLMRIREMIKSGDMESITNLDDAVKINYDTSWLPPYKELRVGLVNAWTNKKRRWDEQSGSKNKEGHPTMLLGEDVKKEKRCYGCGQLGHMRGAEECKAAKDAVWGGAPKAYLEKIQKKFGRSPTSEKRAFTPDVKRPCPYWSSGDGYCRFAERCHFSHEGPQGGSKRARDFGQGKGKGNGKGKGRGKGKGNGKGKGRGGRGRTPGNTTMIVKKKGVQGVDDKERRSSSMMVSQEGAGNRTQDYDESDTEDELYNLMRGHTSLMMAEGSDLSEDEKEDEDENEGDEKTSELDEDIKKEESSSVAPEWGSSVGMSKAPTWGNIRIPDSAEQEIANEWQEKGRILDRKSREEEIARGGSPPPKFDEENLFTEGNSRKRTKPMYRNRYDITDRVEDKEDNTVELFTNGRFDTNYKKRNKAVEGGNSPSSKIAEDRQQHSQSTASCFWSYECDHDHEGEEEEDSSKEESGEEESSSEESDINEPSDENDGEDSDCDDDSDEGTIGQIFKEIRDGTFNASKRRKRFEGQCYNERKVMMSSSYLEEDDRSNIATREDCVMSTAEALYRLTRNKNDKLEEEDEWLIIKVPKKGKKLFFVDFCDGDDVDEFQWLEGPYQQKHLTIEDLLDRRRSQSRKSRRRRGEAEFRNDEVLDQRDQEGNLLPTFHDCCPRQRPSCLKEKHNASPRIDLCSLCHHGVHTDLRSQRQKDEGIDANPNDEVKNNVRAESKRSRRPKKPMKIKSSDDEDNNTAMMTKEEKHNKKHNHDEPLHDMTCIGIDTCSARSISCLREDFLDLEIIQSGDDHLRGIGGTKGVAGKGCMIFYAKDLDGKMKAIVEPKGFYLENPPAQFRILGQQRMKQKGLCVTQDYDDAGTDILKCKRSGVVLPLTEGRGLLLLKTFTYTPTAELKEQLRSYVQRLKQDKHFLPHVIDLDELKSEGNSILIMNEGNLNTENYERLLHWRLGHTSSKVLKAMDLIDKSHLNEDCYCCNQAKFKRAPFPKN